MSKRSEMAREMYAQGKTYEEIADILGVTRNEAYKKVHTGDGDGFRKETVAKVRYAGLRKWMFDNRVNLNELKNRSGMTGLKEPLTGRCEPRKCTIDAILKVTGMTYEECFGVEDGGLK